MAYPLGTVVQNANNWTETITATGTWTAPTVATNGFTIATMQIECIGGGGNGGAGSALAGGGGGGGGAYSKLNSFSPGTTGTNYTATVGTGAPRDVWFSTTGTVLAKGGVVGGAANLGTPGTAGAGGASGSGVGDTKFSGGNGAAGTATAGGGGGGGAGTGGAGGAASGATGGTGTATGGGNGGDGPLTGAGAGGSVQGGGGSGGGLLSGAGGTGARGYIVLTYNKQYSSSLVETAGSTDEGSSLLTGDDSDFEAGVGIWSSPAFTASSSTDQANTGTHSLKLVRNSPGGTGSALTGGIVVTAGQNYVFYISARTAVTSRVVTPNIFWYSDAAANVFISSANGTLGQSVADTTSAWQRVSIAAEAPPGAVRARLVVTYGNAVTSEAHYLDTAFLQTSPVDRQFIGARTVSDSEAAPTDAVTRLYIANRTINENVAIPTDAVARQFIGSRNVLESLAAPSDAVTRLFIGNRALAESVVAPTDVVTRVFVANRNLSENIAAPTDVVARIAFFNRVLAESISAPTDSVTRRFVGNRALAENVAKPTDVVTRLAVFNRTVAETLPGEGGGIIVENIIIAPIFD